MITYFELPITGPLTINSERACAFYLGGFEQIWESANRIFTAHIALQLSSCKDFNTRNELVV